MTMQKDPGVSSFLKLALATAFGLGLLPIAPGTWGTLLGVAGYLLAVFFLPPQFIVAALALYFLIVCITHFILTPWAVSYFKSDDPKNFVLDEVAGYLVVPLILIPTAPAVPIWITAFFGFLFFRIFDIIKFPPARQIDRDMHGAWGILLDDIVSGIYAAAAVYLTSLIF